MRKFSDLQAKHVELLERYKGQKDSPDLLNNVKEYTEQAINASREIGDSRERDQLQANLRFWGTYIYDRTKTYPNLNLLPSEAGITNSTPNAEKQKTNLSWIIIISVLILAVMFFGSGLIKWTLQLTTDPTIETEQAQALQADPTNTPLPTQTPTPFIPTPTPFVIPTPSPVASGGGGGGDLVAFPAAYSEDGLDCSSHKITITIDSSFYFSKPSQPVEPAILTISEEGTFRNIVKKSISINTGESQQDDSTQEISVEVDIRNAKGSYLLYISHPVLTFGAVIFQHMPDCQENMLSITYQIPSEGYDQLPSRQNQGINFNLVAWGPMPEIDPSSGNYSPGSPVARIHVSSTEKNIDPIFWMNSETSSEFQLLQNDEFIAKSGTGYYIASTFAGKTVSIPFIFVTPNQK